MTVQELIDKLEVLPSGLKDRPVMYDTDFPNKVLTEVESILYDATNNTAVIILDPFK